MKDFATFLAGVMVSGDAPPDYAEAYVRIMSDLHETRSWSAGGFPLAISFQEIAAYCALMGWPLAPHQVEVIRAVDRAYLASLAGPVATSEVARPVISADAFDAVFG